ncbi:MAG: hypothetical protein JWO58_843 [Chitinophagaceae bacterium]|nr:hypothetical protein [Chitinophagaceae bacterium]
MKKYILSFLLLSSIAQQVSAQFIVRETDFEWFPFGMKSNRCAIEAIVPKRDGSVEVNTFTQVSGAVMVQTGIFAGSVGGYQHYPLMNTKKFDADLKIKSSFDDYYNYRMFIPADKQNQKLNMMLADRLSTPVEVSADSNYFNDMIRKYPYAIKSYGDQKVFFETWRNDPPEDRDNKVIRIYADTIGDYDARANAYLKDRTGPLSLVNPIIERKTPEGKRMEAMELLTSNDYSVLQRYAFVTPVADEDKWAMYKHRIIVTYDGNGVKTNETPVVLNFSRKESYVSEVRNVEDNKTNGFIYIYHRVFGLSKKNLDTVLGNYEVVYLDKVGNKQFQYTFKITEKPNKVNPFVSYAKEGKVNLLFFGHPDDKTMAVTSFVLSSTGVENVQSTLLGDWRALTSGAGASISGWADDGFLLQDVVQDKNGFIYLIGEKRTDSSIPGNAAPGASALPIPIHIYPSHIVLVIGPDGKPVRQHVIKKLPLTESSYDKTYQLITNDKGVFLIYKDPVGPGTAKPFHSLTLSNRSEIQRNLEANDYAVRVVGLNDAALNEYNLPLNLYHSKKGIALDDQKQNLYLIAVDPKNMLPRLFKVSLW